MLDQINKEYVAEIEAYREKPVPPCSRADALKLLKRFSGKGFADFWQEPVTPYLPAVSCGIMKLSDTVYPHDEAITYAKTMIAPLSEAELAKAFLYGVAHGAPEYMRLLLVIITSRTFRTMISRKNGLGQVLKEKCIRNQPA